MMARDSGVVYECLACRTRTLHADECPVCGGDLQKRTRGP